jgi:hypothetical protein
MIMFQQIIMAKIFFEKIGQLLYYTIEFFTFCIQMNLRICPDISKNLLQLYHNMWQNGSPLSPKTDWSQSREC